ncbi:small-conductance mechanosensitive channel [Bacilli bacterium PM5-3]|nr:small-conductance mechanosensitive channel [Bacilli bacterium PM5-3]MDH6603608.1 small-conductance mechanosensitive channel [Bacilli bacterium PM5-9]
MYLTNIKEFIDNTSQFLINSQLTLTIIIIIVAFLISKFMQKLVYNIVILFSSDKNKSKTNKLLKSYCNIIATVLKYVIYAIAIFVILAVYNVQLVVVLTSAGFIGVMITYIFQDLIKDITNGFYIVFSAPFEIGDRVTIDGFTGKVKEINSRYVVLSDVSGNKCIINNRKIDKVTILNKTIEFKKR